MKFNEWIWNLFFERSEKQNKYDLEMNIDDRQIDRLESI